MRRATFITALTASFATISSSAMAHGGHIADVGHGHSHFEIISAVAVIAIAATLFAKNRFYS